MFLFKKYIFNIGFALLAGSLLPCLAKAACTAPAGVNGQLLYIAPYLRICNNTTWLTAGNYPVYNSSVVALTCTAGEAGKFNHANVGYGYVNEVLTANTNVLRFCNGTNWKQATGAGYTGPTCTGAEAGKFYYNTTRLNYSYCTGTYWQELQ